MFKKSLCVFALCLSALGARAFCFAEAAARYKVPEPLLVAIAHHESRFNPQATHVNNDKSIDYGVMQINSTNLPALAKYNIDVNALMDPCTNVHVGAWILSDFIRTYGPTWRAVGGYAAGNRKDREESRQIYANQIMDSYRKVLAGKIRYKNQAPEMNVAMQVVE